MLKSAAIIICALALIGIGFYWGLDSNTPATGNEKIIRAEQVHADVVFTQRVALVDDKGNIGGFFSMTDDGDVMLSLDRSDARIVFHMQAEGPMMRLGKGNDGVMISVSDIGPSIMLSENNNIVVLVGTMDGDGVVMTSDKRKNVTGTLPR